MTLYDTIDAVLELHRARNCECSQGLACGGHCELANPFVTQEWFQRLLATHDAQIHRVKTRMETARVLGDRGAMHEMELVLAMLEEDA